MQSYKYFDIRKTYFSRALSWLSLTLEKGYDSWTGLSHENRLLLRTNRYPFSGSLYYIDLYQDGKEVKDLKYEMSPYLLTISYSEQAYLKIYLPQECDSSIVLFGKNLDIKLVPLIGNSYKPSDSVYSIKLNDTCTKSIYSSKASIVYTQHHNLTLDDIEKLNVPHGEPHQIAEKLPLATHGDFSLSKEAHGKPFFFHHQSDSEFKLMLSVFNIPTDYLRLEQIGTFDCVRDHWEKSVQEQAEIIKDDFDLFAWYNLWASFVRGKQFPVHGIDFLRFDTSLCTKRYMNAIWSWDHCFPALALTATQPQTALEQFLVPFQMQDTEGGLPDWIHASGVVHWGVTKAPIHGLIFSHMMKQHNYTLETLRSVYGHLERWTEWWFKHTDVDGDGLPEYPQGCDCWDNATSFDKGLFLKSADLPFYLILQMHCLSDIAKKMDLPHEAKRWIDRANITYTKVIEELWDEEKKCFPTKLAVTNTLDPNEKCLLIVMPIILGEYLDKKFMDPLIHVMDTLFVTEYGIATESPQSSFYTPDGYWRGPTWAPVVFLLVSGLARAGYRAKAIQLADNFIQTIRNAGGMYENFDSITGAGLCDPGYNWTTAVYFILKNHMF